MRGFSGFATLLSVSVSIVLSGCGVIGGMAKDDTAVPSRLTAGLSGNGKDALLAFQTSFYAFARINCAQCHGLSQQPLFASSDVNSAYTIARVPPYADFQNPSDSLFVQYAGNGHCGVSNCSGPAQSSAVLSAIQTWAVTELTQGSSGGGDTVNPLVTVLTDAMPIPSNVPSAPKTAVMRWNLSNLSPSNPALSGAVFEIQIQMVSQKTYLLSSPRLASPSGPVTVTGIHVMIKTAGSAGAGTEDPMATTWLNVNTTVAQTSVPNPLPATPLTVPTLSSDSLPIATLSSSDALTIGFEKLTRN